MRGRPAPKADRATIWSVILPEIREGATYALEPRMREQDALDYWMGSDRQTFVAEFEYQVFGTSYLRANQSGGGDHVCNCGYMTHRAARGCGVVRQLAEDSIDRARAHG